MLNKGRYNQSYDFSSSHVLMWVGTIRKAEWKELMLSNCGARETLQSPLDRKEIKPVNPKGNQPWIFIRTEAKAPILWPPNAKSQLLGKDPDVGKDWGQKGVREDEMGGWHHRLNGHESEQTRGDSEGKGSLACCNPWGCKESDTTEKLNNRVRGERGK